MEGHSGLRFQKVKGRAAPGRALVFAEDPLCAGGGSRACLLHRQGPERSSACPGQPAWWWPEPRPAQHHEPREPYQGVSL